MNKFYLVITIWLILFSILPSYAQDSLTLNDVSIIQYQAERIVKKDLNDLLNAIANSEYDPGDRKMIISNSYKSGNRLNIFYDNKIIVEDDIDPSYKSSGNDHNSPISKYLDDYDLLYKKSNNQSVIFSNIRPSKPKKSKDNYIFVKVYYNSFFRNKNNDDKEYTINYRAAEIRMEKKENKWLPLIDGITFFSPEDTLINDAHDVPLYSEKVIVNSTVSATPASDSASAATRRKKIEALAAAEETQRLIKEEKDLSDKFDELMAKGEKALRSNDFPTAIQYFKEAKELKPLDRQPLSKIIEVTRTQHAMNLSKQQIYDEFTRKGDAEEKKRNYREASRLYKNALKEMPDKTSLLEGKIKEMDDKWEIVAELELKYEAGVNIKDLIDDYDRAIKKNKGNSDLYAGRGQCYEKINNLSKALKDYDYAYNIDKKNLQALLLRAELKKKRNEKDDNFSAMADYTKYLNSNDQDLPVYEAMSDLRFVIKQDDYNGALKDIENGLLIDSKHATFYYKKGLILTKKNDTKEAIKNFTIALNYDSTLALAYFYRGKSQLILNSIEYAALDFESARKKGLDQENIIAIGTYAGEFLVRATKKFAESSIDSAIILIDYAISFNALNSEYWFNRGNYFIAKNNYQESIKCFDQAIKLNSSFIEAYFKLGFSYFNLKDYNSAVKSFSKTIELDLKHFRASKGLGDAYFALNDYANAVQSFESYLKIVNAGKNIAGSEIISMVYNSIGMSYFKLNNMDSKSLEAYNNSIKKNINNAEAYYNRGRFYYNKKELSDAIKDFEKSVTLDTKHAEWNYELGVAYHDKRDFQNAITYLKSSIVLDTLKDNGMAIYLLANSNYELQDFEGALINYKKVQTINFDSVINNFNYELGDTYLKLNKPDSAFEYLHKAYIQDSTSGTILYLIATSHFLKGNIDESLIWFEKAFQTGKLKQKMVKNDKLIGNLREDKRFKTLMKKYL